MAIDRGIGLEFTEEECSIINLNGLADEADRNVGEGFKERGKGVNSFRYIKKSVREFFDLEGRNRFENGDQ